MEKEYITVKEFSELVGITPQAAYKSVNLKPFINVVNGQKLIDKAALTILYPEKVVKRCETVANSESVEKSAFDSIDNSTVEQPTEQPLLNGLTTDLLEYFQKEIEEKNKQIAEQSKQIEQLHQIIINQQQLSLQSNTKTIIETIETIQHTEDKAADSKEQEQQTQEQPPKRKSIFSFLKSKNKENERN